jgi:hypothetical protein
MEALFNLNKNNKDAGKDQDKSKIKQAENIWSMLDEMALTSPDAYKYIRVWSKINFYLLSLNSYLFKLKEVY